MGELNLPNTSNDGCLPLHLLSHIENDCGENVASQANWAAMHFLGYQVNSHERQAVSEAVLTEVQHDLGPAV